MDRQVWDVGRVQQALDRVGIRTPRSATAETLDAVADAFTSLEVARVVLKAGGLVHKTDAGGVVLGLDSAQATTSAAQDMVARIGDEAAPFVLQEQVSGRELLVGARRDPQLGAALVVGLGGVDAEIHNDVVQLVAPVDAEQARAALRRLRVWPLLEGHRGQPGIDLDALVEVIVCVGRLVVDEPSIVELDLNPVLVGEPGQGAVTVDARIIADPAIGEDVSRGRADLSRLLEPDNVAVVGVSDDPHKVGSRLFRYLTSHGFAGRIDPVHPSGGTIHGQERFATLRDLPHVPDLVCIAVPARFVLDIAREAVELGVGGIIVHSSDFAEVGDEGRAAQAELATLAQAAGIPLLGPNCMGVVSPPDNLASSISGGLESDLVAGSIALVTSSGALGSCLASRLMGAGIGLSRWVHVGNESDRVVADFVEWLAEDDATAAVGLLLEDLKDGPRFLEAARAIRATGKPVFAYSMARSDKGREAALSHTGAMVGSFAHREELLRAAGVVSVPSLRVLEDALIWATTAPAPRGRRLMAVTLSGGACSIIADEAEIGGVALPPLAATTAETVAEFVPAYAAVRNPLDCSYQMLASPEGFERALEGLLAGDEFDALLLQFTTNADPYAVDLAKAVIRVSERVEVPVYVSRYGGDHLAPQAMAAYREAGMTVLDSPDRATQAIAAVMSAYDSADA